MYKISNLQGCIVAHLEISQCFMIAIDGVDSWLPRGSGAWQQWSWEAWCVGISPLEGDHHWEDPLEKGMATHSNILAWRIPWTEEPGGLQSKGLQWVRQD